MNKEALEKDISLLKKKVDYFDAYGIAKPAIRKEYKLLNLFLAVQGECCSYYSQRVNITKATVMRYAKKYDVPVTRQVSKATLRRRERWNKIAKLLSQGYSISDIAVSMGVSRQFISAEKFAMQQGGCK